MGNPGAFQGTRFEFLTQQLQVYATAMAEGTVADVLANIYRRYFKRYPVDLDHKQEPTSEYLAKVNDDEPDEEQEVPDPDKMTTEEFEAAMELLEARTHLITARQKVRCDPFTSTTRSYLLVADPMLVTL